MSRIIAVSNQKGGVGKTTTTYHLGAALAQRGRRVLLIDLDKQHSLSDLFDTKAAKGSMYDVLGDRYPGEMKLPQVIIPTYIDGQDLAPATDDLVVSEEYFSGRDMREIQLSNSLDSIQRNYDYVIIDTSPGLGFMLMNALVAADEVIVPVQCAPLDLRGFQLLYKTLRRAREAQKSFGSVRLYLRAIVPTFYHQGHVVDEEMLEALRAAPHPDYPDQPMPISEIPVPATTLFRQSTLTDSFKGRTQTIFEMEPEHPGSLAYQELAGMIDE